MYGHWKNNLYIYFSEEVTWLILFLNVHVSFMHFIIKVRVTT